MTFWSGPNYCHAQARKLVLRAPKGQSDTDDVVKLPMRPGVGIHWYNLSFSMLKTYVSMVVAEGQVSDATHSLSNSPSSIF